jgi:hypothetical protein
MMRKYRVSIPRPWASFEFAALSDAHAIEYFKETTAADRRASLWYRETLLAHKG